MGFFLGLIIGLVVGIFISGLGAAAKRGDLVHRNEIDRVIKLNRDRAFEEGRLYERRNGEQTKG